MVNLLSNDVTRFDISTIFLHFLWVGPLETIVVLYFLWTYIGIASVFGVCILLALIPLQGILMFDLITLVYFKVNFLSHTSIFGFWKSHNVSVRIWGFENCGVAGSKFRLWYFLCWSCHHVYGNRYQEPITVVLVPTDSDTDTPLMLITSTVYAMY